MCIYESMMTIAAAAASHKRSLYIAYMQYAEKLQRACNVYVSIGFFFFFCAHARRGVGFDSFESSREAWVPILKKQGLVTVR